MTFTQFCVGLVITVLVFVVAFLIGLIFCEMFHYDRDEQFYFGAWLVSSIGFGICLTMLLYQNGVIK